MTTAVRKIIKKSGLFCKTLLAFIARSSCCLCGGAVDRGENFFCGDCRSSIRMSLTPVCCDRCGRKVSPYSVTDAGLGCRRCLDEEFEFDCITAVGIYDGRLRDMILKLKLSDRTELAEPLGELFATAFGRSDFAGGTDYIAAVPMHWKKRWKRGYNSPGLIAKKLCKKNPGIKFSDCLVRIRHTENQAGLTMAGRRRNVKGAFAVRKGVDFTGSNICLVDDVKTSGATLSECAAVLKEAGAVRVFAVTAAVAGQKDTERYRL